MATTLPNTGAIIPAMTEPADQAVNNAAFTAIDTKMGAHLAESATDNVHGLKDRSCIIRLLTPVSIPHNTYTTISFNGSVNVSDAADFWNVSQPTRLTVPLGASKVQIFFTADFDPNITGSREVEISKNGGYPAECPAVNIPASPTNTTRIIGASAIIRVVPGDYFEFIVRQTSGGTLILGIGKTSFGIKVIG